MNRFTLPQKEKRLSKELALLIKFGVTQLNKVKRISSTSDVGQDLIKATILQMFSSTNYLCRGILAVTQKGLPEVGIILLRSLLENSINASYIVLDKTGLRARAFYADSENKRSMILHEWLNFITNYPEHESKFRHKHDIEQSITVLDDDIKRLKHDYADLNFLDLKSRAVAIDKQLGKHDNEMMYITVYRYFSSFTHFSATGLNSLLKQAQETIEVLSEQHTHGLETLLISAYGMYLGFLSTLNEHFNLGLNARLQRFESKLIDLSDGRINFGTPVGDIE